MSSKLSKKSASKTIKRFLGNFLFDWKPQHLIDSVIWYFISGLVLSVRCFGCWNRWRHASAAAFAFTQYGEGVSSLCWTSMGAPFLRHPLPPRGHPRSPPPASECPLENCRRAGGVVPTMGELVVMVPLGNPRRRGVSVRAGLGHEAGLLLHHAVDVPLPLQQDRARVARAESRANILRIRRHPRKVRLWAGVLGQCQEGTVPVVSGESHLSVCWNTSKILLLFTFLCLLEVDTKLTQFVIHFVHKDRVFVAETNLGQNRD